jgi:hypothetical protein
MTGIVAAARLLVARHIVAEEVPAAGAWRPNMGLRRTASESSGYRFRELRRSTGV